MPTHNDQDTQASRDAKTDWFLQLLVNMTNDSDFEIGITLQVSGLLVSGKLISGKHYFDAAAADFASPFASTPDVAESIKSTISSYGDIYSKESDNHKMSPPQYLHLKDARFFNTFGTPVPENKGVLWRGRICEVGGFVLGTLSGSNHEVQGDRERNPGKQ